MGARGEGLLMAEEKNLYDPRGRLSNLRRLRDFDMEALIHLISYRLLIIASLLTVVFFALSLAAPALQVAWKALLVLDWIFFSTQVFETLKGLMLTGSGGIAFGRLNESYLSAMVKNTSRPGYKAVPYVALVLWVIGLFVLIAEMIA